MKSRTFLFIAILIIFAASLCYAQDLSPKQKKHEVRIAALKKLIESPIYNDFEDFTKDVMKDEQGQCSLHHVELKKLLVPIIYGHMIDFKEIGWKEFFPNAKDRVLGGFITSPSDKRRALVLQCSRCIEVREEVWLSFMKCIEDKKVRN